MINITNKEFNADTWNDMVIQAANSCREQINHKHICRVIYPNNTCTLELKTDQEVKQHFQKYGIWKANCGKMRLSEVINITRITSLNNPVRPERTENLKNALNDMAGRAEKKYESGLGGVIRKIISLFFNLFTSDAVSLFEVKNSRFTLVMTQNREKNKLPFFIGNDAEFARRVATNI